MRFMCILRVLLFYFLLILQFTSCKNRDDKALTIQQAHISLEKGYEAYLHSEIINKMILEIRKEGLSQHHLKNLDSLTHHLIRVIDGDIDELIKRKRNYQNTELFDSTIAYLEIISKYEKHIPEFFRVLNDSVQENDGEAKNNMRKLALLVKEQGDKWDKSKILFYEKYGIKQKEVDSIERIVKSAN